MRFFYPLGAQKRIPGEVTEDIREKQERQGFRLAAFDGSERVLAHVGFPKLHRVGKYGVDVAAIENTADRLAIDADADIYLLLSTQKGRQHQPPRRDLRWAVTTPHLANSLARWNVKTDLGRPHVIGL